MQEHRYEDLERAASIAAERDELKQAEASARVRKEIKRMLARGDAFTLSEEEEQMLLSFRKFRSEMRKQSAVFTWQTTKPDSIHQAPHDPQAVKGERG